MDEREYLQEQQYLAGERSAEIEEAQSDPVYYADEATVMHLSLNEHTGRKRGVLMYGLTERGKTFLMKQGMFLKGTFLKQGDV